MKWILMLTLLFLASAANGSGSICWSDEYSCSNGYDDDCDGAIDYADSDCVNRLKAIEERTDRFFPDVPLESETDYTDNYYHNSYDTDDYYHDSYYSEPKYDDGEYDFRYPHGHRDYNPRDNYADKYYRYNNDYWENEDTYTDYRYERSYYAPNYYFNQIDNEDSSIIIVVYGS